MKTKVNKLSPNERMLYNIYSQLTSPVLQEKEIILLEEQRQAIHDDTKAAKAYIKKIVREQCSLDEAIKAAAWGFINPAYHMVDREKIETVECDICSGKGYTEYKMKPITKEIVVGYEKEK